MNEFRADLHCHSSYSDGSDSPEALIRYAIEKKLQGLSITDHDTLSAYPESLTIASKLQFLLLPGVELSSVFQNENVHVLGYAFSIQNESIHDLCERHRKRREERNRKILGKLKGLGIVIEFDEVKNQFPNVPALGRPHLALALQKHGIVGSVKEAFDKFLGDGKAAYDPGERFSVQETIDVIHKSRGLAVLAHPHLMKPKIARAVLQLPFDGIEGFYARCTREQEKPWVDWGQKKNLIVTGGSDYHGSVKPESILGSSWVGKETFDRLYERFLQNQ